MTRRMLIDATHAEETRVAVVDGTRLIDYDYESTLRKQLKGSIFLAKVTRVEPSLQAAFVNFGGNRHGFLPFNEIHPDYYRIPIADREALLAAQQAELEALQAEEEAEDEEEEEREASGGVDAAAEEHEEDEDEEEEDEDDAVVEVGGENSVAPEDSSGVKTSAGEEALPVAGHDEAPAPGNEATEAEDESAAAGNEKEPEAEDADGNRRDRDDQDNPGRGRHGRGRQRGGRGRRGRDRNMPARSRRFEKRGDRADSGPGRRHYKIQEVVKRGQIMLVQVSREERGNKGAAVTTYLSLPGRYCVLMPNSHRGGGVSRKVASFQERKRMKEMLAEMEVPQGMSVIMRTAGVSRTKPEIRRDLDYLLKLWDGIRDLTLKSTAPALVHEEGQLIRRAIRDIYSRDIDEIHVAGEEGYKTAREFMKMMIPSHVKRVNQHTDEKTPLFHRYQVEGQIAGMVEPTVTLKSGGYLVINPTEALVSVDVNSGRATRERHIEETALKTNLEAADEVARQLKLRDLGGLVVIDFIDMEDRRNNRKVENRLRDALSSDRARIQVGRISSFGLLELSRQRLNPSLTEAQFERCSHCKGIGFVRTVDMTAIMAMRALEEEGIKARTTEVALNVSHAVALYILNNKRGIVNDIERRYGFKVMIRVDDTLPPDGFRAEPLRGASGGGNPALAPAESSAASAPAPFADEEEPEQNDGAPSSAGPGREDNRSRPHPDGDDGQGRRRGRRRGRRGGRGRRDRGSDGNNNNNNNNNESRAEDAAPPSLRGSDEPRPVVAEEREEPVSVKEAPLQAVAAEKAAPSNDAAPPPRDYERVNEPPASKKKGWWNRLTE